jgi:hypothetical protein
LSERGTGEGLPTEEALELGEQAPRAGMYVGGKRAKVLTPLAEQRVRSTVDRVGAQQPVEAEFLPGDTEQRHDCHCD